jgi:tetratricopeptide (TPR) repeat protein
LSIPNNSHAELAPYLNAMLELDPPSRDAWLDALSQSAPHMAALVREFLSESTRPQTERPLEQVHVEAPSATLSGQHFGAYALDHLLGSGGMGTVWLAHRSDGRFEGRAAVKLLNASLVGHPAEQRFVHEGSLLAKLQHPNIAHLLDAGIAAGRQPYLVLELVEGVRIDHYCDTHRLNVRERLKLFIDVLAAVAHAHNHLIIHRDIKPTNILITTQGTVKLLDFGIARLIETENAATLADQRALTPDYAAPEQFKGEAVTTALDVYSLGVLLHLLLCGQHPLASAGEAMMGRIKATLEIDPPRLSAVLAQPADAARGFDPQQIAAQRCTSLTRLKRELAGDLENIVSHALHKQPTARYDSAAAFSEDLRRYLTDRPVLARPDAWLYRCGKFVRRRRGIVAAIGLIALSIAGGIVSTLVQAHRVEAQARLTQRERDRALRQLAYAESSTEFITYLLEDSAAEPFTTPQLLDRGVTAMREQFADDPAQHANLSLLLGSLYTQASSSDKALDLLLEARAAARRTNDASMLANIECAIAQERANQGAFEIAVAAFESIKQRLRSAVEVDRTALANCLIASSQSYFKHGDLQAARADVDAGLTALSHPRAGQRMLRVLLKSVSADIENARGESATAVRTAREVVEQMEQMGRGRTRLNVTMLQNMGSLLARSGQPRDAVTAYEKARGILRGFGNSASNPVLEANYGKALIELGRFAEAQQSMERSLMTTQATEGDQTVASIALAGAPAWCATGELDRCAQLLARARAILVPMLPPTHSRIGMLEVAQAQLALARGELPAASASLRRATEIFAAARDNNQTAIRAWTLLARVEVASGELPAARAHAAQAVSQGQAAMAGFAHSAWLGHALVAQGLAQRALGDGIAARTSLHAAVRELQATLGESAPATREARELLTGSSEMIVR